MFNALEPRNLNASTSSSPTESWNDFEAHCIRWFRSQEWEQSFALCLGRMGGFDSPESHAFRQEALAFACQNNSKRPDVIAAVARGLSSCRSEQAHALRLELLSIGAPTHELHAGLIHCDDAVHHVLRKKLLETNPLLDDSGYLQGLIGCEGEEAITFRRTIVRKNPSLAAQIAESLIGCDQAEAHSLRRDLVQKAELMTPDSRRILMTGILIGLAGCTSASSIELRWMLFAKNSDYAAIARSCIGAWSPNLSDLWECAAAQVPQMIAELLAGINTPESHTFREKIFRCGGSPLPLLRSLAGCDGAEAWKLRREFAKTIPEATRAAPLLSSIARCRSKKAWELREQAATAGVSRLDLLEGTIGDGEPSFWIQESRTLPLTNRIDQCGFFVLYSFIDVTLEGVLYTSPHHRTSHNPKKGKSCSTHLK